MITDKNELEYLEKVKAYINSRLSSYDEEVLSLREYIREERQRMWDDFIHDFESPEGVFELVQFSQTESRDAQRYDRAEKENAALKVLVKSPYFARLDFKEQGYDEETIYIGRRSLSDKDSSEILVCDWRSDLAGMFYDSPLGKTSYTSVDGPIPCELLLRRQYKIVNGELLYMFDSDIAVEDDILQQELGKTSDAKLKTIISTIQAEQNTVIRNLDSTLLLVSGVAGSGKTSVALHRLAYLLYKYRKTLTSANIIIFSPNNVFNAYIADVLPDLGEDKVLQTSFFEFLSTYFKDKTALPMSDQTERIFAKETDIDEIKLKGSAEFAAKLKEYFEKTAVSDLDIKSIKIGPEEVRTKEELEYLYFDLYKTFLPSVRVNKIKEGVIEYCENNIKHHHRPRYEHEISQNGVIEMNEDEMNLECESRWQGELGLLAQEIEKMLIPDLEKAYLSVLKSYSEVYYEKTKARLESGTLYFEDMLPLAYLKVLCGKIREQRRIKHIVIDEAQDYPAMLYLIIADIFKESKHTVLGDPDQAFVPHLESIKDISAFFNVPKTVYVDFKKTYRSTVEINTFLQSILKNTADTKFFERHGEEVSYEKPENFEKTVAELSQKYPSTAVICKTYKETEEAYKALTMSGVRAKLVGPEDMVFPDETVVLPSYLTKGLEFDAVVIFDKKRETKDDDKVYYVCASRALHKLVVIK